MVKNGISFGGLQANKMPFFEKRVLKKNATMPPIYRIDPGNSDSSASAKDVSFTVFH